MPEGRIVLKSICTSKKLSKLKTDGARLLYTWLIPNLNVQGCYEADPITIQGTIMPRLKKSIETIEEYLQDLANNKLILIYEANNDVFLFVPDFVEKQPRLRPDREAKPRIPLPTAEQLKSLGTNMPQVVGIAPVDETKQEGTHFKFQFEALGILKNLEDVVLELCELSPDFHWWEMVQYFWNQHSHPGAIIDVLKQISQHIKLKTLKKGPWAFANKVMPIKSKNYNERDAVRIHEQIKNQSIDDMPEEIQSVVKTLFKGMDK